MLKEGRSTNILFYFEQEDSVVLSRVWRGSVTAQQPKGDELVLSRVWRGSAQNAWPQSPERNPAD